MEWISVKDRLPKVKERDARISCIVTLQENVTARFDEVERRQLALPAEYDPLQKLWIFEAVDCTCNHYPVNALLGEADMVDEDGEDIDWACYVSHWMPYPAPAKEMEAGKWLAKLSTMKMSCAAGSATGSRRPTTWSGCYCGTNCRPLGL